MAAPYPIKTDRDGVPWEPPVPGAEPIPKNARTQGERRLMQELIEIAIKEAKYPPSHIRDEARAWLSCAGFTARDCCQALDIDYGAMMKALRGQWAEADTRHASEPKRLH